MKFLANKYNSKVSSLIQMWLLIFICSDSVTMHRKTSLVELLVINIILP